MADKTQEPQNDQQSLESMLDPQVLQNLIAAGVQQYLAQNPVKAPEPVAKKPNAGFVVQKPVVQPDKFLKHYRHANSKNIKIMELDMSALDRGENPAIYPIKGSYMQFTRGHFYATTKNQVRQLDWMSKRPKYSANQEQVVGGDPGIYEDDGEQIYYCPSGCSHADVQFASMKSLARHMKAVHNMDVEF